MRGHILFNAAIYKSAYPTYSYKNIVFHLSMFCIFCLFYFELEVIFINFL